MKSEVMIILIYLMPMLLILTTYLYKRKKQHRLSQQYLTQAKQDGLTEPASLHPLINPLKCLGCASCISACPEQNVLGLIDRQAHLITPANCIGHGACKTSCPQHAITLVFGSATRGVDIPELSSDFQTNIPGIFIAGELGGMGLIKNAIEQGRQAMNSIEEYVKKHSKPTEKLLDCVVVGAGPAGLSAMLGAKEKHLNIVTIDQDVAGGTVSHFPRGKLVMTAPAQMPIVGKVNFGEVSKEKLLDFWLKLIEKHELKINQNETMLDITVHEQGHFILTSSKQSYQTQSVLLAIGRRGSPRKLGVEGEEHSKVVYRLIDAEQYENEDVLVVGGGDSALEAACSIAQLGRCRVSISYRSDSFARAKAKNRAKVEQLVSCGDLHLYMSSQVTSITKDTVALSYQNEKVSLVNTVVIICAGGVLPTPFLKKTGIMVATKYGTE
jgi:thioredoxin reductase/Pyruvate/2-oxoacid:ferredoxin oxidoreductase delta subunit